MENLAAFNNRRERHDRRNTSLTTIYRTLCKGRRCSPRRQKEKSVPYYTDRYSNDTLLLILPTIALCVADAGLTLTILAHGGMELNPVMAALLEIDSRLFFAGKYLLTSVGLIIILVHINFSIFRYISMRQVLIALLGMYLMLIGYELTLLPLL